MELTGSADITRPAACRNSERQDAAAAVERWTGRVTDTSEPAADAAVRALIKGAILDVMRLFDETRATARYTYAAYPALPDILKKSSKKEPDQIWETHLNFHHPDYSLNIPGSVAVTALDVNAAYLSALKCWLPIGKLSTPPAATAWTPSDPEST